MALRLLRLQPELITRCRNFAIAVVQSYKDGNNDASLSVSTHGAETNVDLWTEAKMAECVFALEFNLDPYKDVGWEMRPDKYDVLVGETRVDVKSGQMTDRFLIWPIGKNHLFKQKQFDVLVFTKIDIIYGGGASVGWVSKGRFLRERQIADEHHKLMTGTRYMEQEQLDPIRNFPGGGPCDPPIYRCHCGQIAHYGVGVHPLKGEEGQWFCSQHRPVAVPSC